MVFFNSSKCMQLSKQILGFSLAGLVVYLNSDFIFVSSMLELHNHPLTHFASLRREERGLAEASHALPNSNNANFLSGWLFIYMISYDAHESITKV